MSGRALEHGIGLMVDHGGASNAKMYVGGQAAAEVAVSSTHGGDSAAATETAHHSFEVPASTLVAGSTIRLRFAGKVIADSGASKKLQYFVRFGPTATALASREIVVASADAAVSSGDVFVGDILIQIRSATKAIGMASFQEIDAIGTAPKKGLKDEFSIVTAEAMTLSLSTQWEDTTAGNTCRNDIFVVDIVNPST